MNVHGVLPQFVEAVQRVVVFLWLRKLDFVNCQDAPLRAEALAAGAVRHGIGVRDLEAALLQVVAEIEQRTADEKRAFGIDDHTDTGALDHDVAVGRPIDEIHLVLEPGATTPDDRHP
jgi:hypothetical protein